MLGEVPMAKRFLVLIFLLLAGCTPINNTVVIPAVTPTVQEFPSPTSTVIVTPDPDALNRWGNKNAAVTANRLGTGTVSAMALSPDGKTIAVTGIVSVSTYDLSVTKISW